MGRKVTHNVNHGTVGEQGGAITGRNIVINGKNR